MQDKHSNQNDEIVQEEAQLPNTTLHQKRNLNTEPYLQNDLTLRFNTTAGLYRHNPEEDLEETITTIEQKKNYIYNPSHYAQNGFYVSTIRDEKIQNKIDELLILMQKPAWHNRSNAQVVFNTMKVYEAQAIRKSLHPSCNAVDRGRNMILVSKMTRNKREEKSKRLAEEIGEYLQTQICRELNIYKKRIPSDAPGITLTILETAVSKDNPAVSMSSN